MTFSLPKAFSLSALLVYWSPIDALYYGVGPAWLVLILLQGRFRLPAGNPELRGFYQALLVFLVLFAVSGALNFHHANNLLWACIGYGSVLSMGVVAANLRWEEKHLRFFLKALLWTTLIQIPIGFFQMVRGLGFAALNPFNLSMGAGDYFAGTTLDRFNSAAVALKMSIPFFLLYPFWESSRRMGKTILMGALALGWILPSVMHSLLLGMAAFLGRQCIYAVPHLARLRISKGIFTVAVIVAAVFGTTFWLQRENIRYVLHLGQLALGHEETAPRKIRFVRNTFQGFLWEKPHYFLIGNGPGNYSSRAASIVSGEFLTHQPDFIPVTPSPMADKYVIPLWNRKILVNRYSTGVANMPFSTWLSVLAETGMLGLCAFAAMFAWIWRRIRRQRRSADPWTAKLASGAELLLLYCFGLFFLDNWFEYPAFMGVVMAVFGILLAVPRDAAQADKHASR